LLVRTVLGVQHAQWVDHADPDLCSGEQAGPLGDHATDQQATHAGAARSELLRRRVLVVDEVLAARDEVAHAVHLLVARAVILPAPSLLASAANMRDRVDATALDPRDTRRGEARQL